jgi:hypothetical protein
VANKINVKRKISVKSAKSAASAVKYGTSILSENTEGVAA